MLLSACMRIITRVVLLLLKSPSSRYTIQDIRQRFQWVSEIGRIDNHYRKFPLTGSKRASDQNQTKNHAFQGSPMRAGGTGGSQSSCCSHPRKSTYTLLFYL